MTCAQRATPHSAAALLVMLVALLATTLTATPATAAGVLRTGTASDCMPGTLCGGGSGGDDTPPPTPGEDPGGGGGVVLPAGHFERVRLWDQTASPPVAACIGACRLREHGATKTYGKTCSGGNRWGDWAGVEVVETGRSNFRPGHGTTPGHTWYEVATYDCVSAAAWTEEPIECVTRYNTRVVGPIDNPQIPSVTTTTATVEETPFAETGKRKPVLCERSRILDVGHTLNHYGKWRIVSKPRVVTCTLYQYFRKDVRTKSVPDDRIGDCGPADPRTVIAKTQVFCERPGWVRDWSGHHSFTPQDCLDRPADAIWNCGDHIAATPTLDGRPANPANILNDGADHTLRWTRPAPAGGVRTIDDKQVRFVYQSGTPFRRDTDPAADTQPFVVNPTINDSILGWRGLGSGADTDAIVNFHAASVGGRPWVAVPRWDFTAEFALTVPRVLTTHALSGDWAAIEREPWDRMSATCTGASAQVSVFAPRSR